MNVLAVFRIIGILLLWTAAAMLPSVALSVSEGHLFGWVSATFVTALIGIALWLGTPKGVTIHRRGGLVVVGLGWLCVVVVGSLPFIFIGVAPSVIGALFESVSGFTSQIKNAADSGQLAYDQMLGAEHPEGNQMIQEAIDALIAQTRADEAVVATLGLAIAVEGSDSLDNPALVQ